MFLDSLSYILLTKLLHSSYSSWRDGRKGLSIEMRRCRLIIWLLFKTPFQLHSSYNQSWKLSCLHKEKGMDQSQVKQKQLHHLYDTLTTHKSGWNGKELILICWTSDTYYRPSLIIPSSNVKYWESDSSKKTKIVDKIYNTKNQTCKCIKANHQLKHILREAMDNFMTGRVTKAKQGLFLLASI